MNSVLSSEQDARVALDVAYLALFGLPEQDKEDPLAFLSSVRDMAGSENDPDEHALRIFAALVSLDGNWPAEASPNLTRFISTLTGWTEERAAIALQLAEHKGWLTRSGSKRNPN